MNKDNMYTFLISLDLCIFCVIILSKRSSGAHYQYEACAPTNCRSGPNISFPFYVPTRQESYCGYPGFALNCTDDFPVLRLPENEYVVTDIFYQNRSFHIYNAAVLRSDDSSCLPKIRNTTLPQALFDYVNVTDLHLFSNCKNLSGELLRYNVSCDSYGDGNNGTLALYDKDENLRNAIEKCEENIVAPVEAYGDEGNNGVVNVSEALRRGFVLNWTASDCSICEDSGGRCGFDEFSFHFSCFCPDAPHSKSCKPEFVAMPENSGDLTAGENNISGPDFFGFYASEVEKLLSQDDGLLPFPHQVSHLAGNLHEVGREKGSTKNSCRTKENNAIIGSASLFSNGIGAPLSDSKKERLKSLLRQCVFTLTQEVDEMIDPVLSICQIRSCLRCKESHLSSDAFTCKANQPQHPHKKLKVLPACLDSESEHMHLTVPGKELSDDVIKKCIQCHATSTSQWRPAPDGTKSLCNACGLRYAKNLKNGSIMNSDIESGKGSAELDDDLRFILESDSTKVEELMQNHSSEISATLHHMEQKLEELLNILMTSCRHMTIAEKQQLRKLIQNLPPRNLDRIVEIIGHNKPSEKYSCDEVHVDLDEVDNVALWRLYFYVATIQATTTR